MVLRLFAQEQALEDLFEADGHVDASVPAGMARDTISVEEFYKRVHPGERVEHG